MRIAGHDLRNPLCLILMAGELAKRQPALPAGALKYLANINESATQMRRIIDTFLDLRAPQPGAAAGRIDLALLADAVARQHENAAERKQITLVTELAESLPLARCDAAHAYQLFTNLVSNALKFTPPGGRVTVRLARPDRHLRALRRPARDHRRPRRRDCRSGCFEWRLWRLPSSALNDGRRDPGRFARCRSGFVVRRWGAGLCNRRI